MNSINFKPIGFIISRFKNPKELISLCEKGLKAKTISKIMIKKRYEKGLIGLNKFSHIFIIYFLDKINKAELFTYPGPLTIKKLPKVGVFASRSQYRPNPIALRLVRLLKVENNILTVKGLDGINKSPVLDIKPYVPGFDRPGKTKSAYWYGWLDKN